ncbi:MAG: hypothetical protein ABIP21_07285, partial [Acidimicrobiia bacterium]
MRRTVGILTVASAVAVTGLIAPSPAPAAGAERAEYIVTLRAAAGDPMPAATTLARKTQGTVTHVYRHTVRGFSVSLPLAH